jgi:O-acetyl-ADP-ribose deacetylase (regulator of RNase III)
MVSEEYLDACYDVCLDLAVKSKYRSVAFPSISTGIYGYPLELAAKVVAKKFAWYTRHALETTNLREIRMVCYDLCDLQAYTNAFAAEIEATGRH